MADIPTFPLLAGTRIEETGELVRALLVQHIADLRELVSLANEVRAESKQQGIMYQPEKQPVVRLDEVRKRREPNDFEFGLEHLKRATTMSDTELVLHLRQQIAHIESLDEDNLWGLVGHDKWREVIEGNLMVMKGFLMLLEKSAKRPYLVER